MSPLSLSSLSLFQAHSFQFLFRVMSFPSFPSLPFFPSFPFLPSLPSFPSFPFCPSFPSIPFVPLITCFPQNPSTPFLPSTPSTPFRPFLPSRPSLQRARHSCFSLHTHDAATTNTNKILKATNPFIILISSVRNVLVLSFNVRKHPARTFF